MEEDIKNNLWTEWINVRHFKYQQLFECKITIQEYINFIEDFYKIQTNKINIDITDDGEYT